LSQPRLDNVGSIMHRTSREFLRFAIVGCLNVVVSSLIFYLAYKHLKLGRLFIENTGPLGKELQFHLEHFGIASVDAAVSNAVAYLGGMVNSFILNKTWTFRVKEYSSGQVWRFFTLNVAGLALGTALMLLLVDGMGGQYLIVWSVTIICTTVLNYLGNKYWTFAS
jgi:putative flippase GtrA